MAVARLRFGCSKTETESYHKSADALPLNQPMMLWFVAHVTATAGQVHDPRIDLVRADMNGLPPVTLINAGTDSLRDGGALLEPALRHAGVSVDRKVKKRSRR